MANLPHTQIPSISLDRSQDNRVLVLVRLLQLCAAEAETDGYFCAATIGLMIRLSPALSINDYSG